MCPSGWPGRSCRAMSRTRSGLITLRFVLKCTKGAETGAPPLLFSHSRECHTFWNKLNSETGYWIILPLFCGRLAEHTFVPHAKGDNRRKQGGLRGRGNLLVSSNSSGCVCPRPTNISPPPPSSPSPCMYPTSPTPSSCLEFYKSRAKVL